MDNIQDLIGFTKLVFRWKYFGLKEGKITGNQLLDFDGIIKSYLDNLLKKIPSNQEKKIIIILNNIKEKK